MCEAFCLPHPRLNRGFGARTAPLDWRGGADRGEPRFQGGHSGVFLQGQAALRARGSSCERGLSWLSSATRTTNRSLRMLCATCPPWRSKCEETARSATVTLQAQRGPLPVAAIRFGGPDMWNQGNVRQKPLAPHGVRARPRQVEVCRRARTQKKPRTVACCWRAARWGAGGQRLRTKTGTLKARRLRGVLRKRETLAPPGPLSLAPLGRLADAAAASKAGVTVTAPPT